MKYKNKSARRLKLKGIGHSGIKQKRIAAHGGSHDNAMMNTTTTTTTTTTTA